MLFNKQVLILMTDFMINDGIITNDVGGSIKDMYLYDRPEDLTDIRYSLFFKNVFRYINTKIETENIDQQSIPKLMLKALTNLTGILEDKYTIRDNIIPIDNLEKFLGKEIITIAGLDKHLLVYEAYCRVVSHDEHRTIQLIHIIGLKLAIIIRDDLLIVIDFVTGRLITPTYNSVVNIKNILKSRDEIKAVDTIDDEQDTFNKRKFYLLAELAKTPTKPFTPHEVDAIGINLYDALGYDDEGSPISISREELHSMTLRNFIDTIEKSTCYLGCLDQAGGISLEVAAKLEREILLGKNYEYFNNGDPGELAKWIANPNIATLPNIVVNDEFVVIRLEYDIMLNVNKLTGELQFMFKSLIHLE